MKAIVIGGVLGLVLLAGCTEKPQTNAEGVKHDAVPWSGSGQKADTASAFTAPGWQVGDKDSWTQHMRVRVQHQNDYAER